MLIPGDNTQELRLVVGSVNNSQGLTSALFGSVNLTAMYEPAFRDAGLEVSTSTVESLATGIRESAIKETLIAALDNWARSLRKSRVEDSANSSPEADDVNQNQGDKGTQHITRTKLLDIANKADSNGLRIRIRNALENDEIENLMDLANEDLTRSSDELICWLGVTLREANKFEEAASVLVPRQAFEKSIDDNPVFDNPINWRFIAMCHWQRKDELTEAETEAREWYAKSLEWLKENEPNEELKGFYAEAAELFGEALETQPKPDKKPPADQEPSPEKTPPTTDAQDQPPGKQDVQGETTGFRQLDNDSLLSPNDNREIARRSTSVAATGCSGKGLF